MQFILLALLTMLQNSIIAIHKKQKKKTKILYVRGKKEQYKGVYA